MNPLLKGYYILRCLGPRFIWTRMGIAARRRLGLTRRTFQSRPWNQIDLLSITKPGTPAEPDAYAAHKQSNPPPFIFPLGRPPQISNVSGNAAARHPAFAERLQLLRENRCVYFFRLPAAVPVDWHVNPFEGLRADPTEDWWELPDYSPDQGDMRMFWEPSRAAWAVDLARAKAHGRCDDAGELFWRWVDSWMAANPPFKGFQWKCGQESSVRMIALALGFWSLADDAATTPQRWVQFARLAWATGYRVYHHIDYARSQKNNHAISEACGLLLVGSLFPEFREAERWRETGHRTLEAELRRQIYDDGSYVQHSMNYHRVMLHGAMLGLRLAELLGRPLPRDIYERLGKAGDFAFQMMDSTTGRAPLYGSNDGALVLPLTECDSGDFRSVVQSVHYLVHRRLLLPPGPWDEESIWLFGAEAVEPPAPPPLPPRSRAFDVGGYYTLRRAESWAMIRCHTYRDRPGQCDLLHLDLWWRGLNILGDCGSYHYYVPGRPDIEHYFKSIAAHNTVEIDGADPLQLLSRYLYFPRPRAAVRCFDVTDSAFLCFEGEHYAYDRPPWHVLHRRTVIALEEDVWVVVDDLLGTGRHKAILRWHMIDAPWRIDAAARSVTLQTMAGDVTITVQGHPATPQRIEVIRGRDEPGRVQGFASPYFVEKLPIPTLEVELDGFLPQRLTTVVSPRSVATARLVEESGGAQSWEIGDGQTRWLLDLTPPRRESSKTLLRCQD